jgi:hypothetical protein
MYSYFSVPNIIKLMYNQQLMDVFHLSDQNIEEFCKQITLLFPFQVTD